MTLFKFCSTYSVVRDDETSNLYELDLCYTYDLIDVNHAPAGFKQDLNLGNEIIILLHNFIQRKVINTIPPRDIFFLSYIF